MTRTFTVTFEFPYNFSGQMLTTDDIEYGVWKETGYECTAAEVLR